VIESIEKIRSDADGNWFSKNMFLDDLDAIEREIESGYTELPKDADGEYVRVGDELDGYGKTIEVMELRIGCSGWVIVSRDGNAYADTYAFTHHHKPTIEDVLNELCTKAFHSREIGANVSYKDVIAEYAKRLQIREEQ